MKRLVLILLMLSCLSYVEGQERSFGDVLSEAFLITNTKGYRGQLLKGKRNGMGLLALKKGFVYVGDFYRDGITGYGMMIAPEKQFIDHCENCVVYIGNWNEGKKSGYGTCYDIDGVITYQGQFVDDKPSGKYPTGDVDYTNRFLLLEMDNGNVFIGETKKGMANGYGLISFKNRDLWLSSFKDGQGKGIGLYMFANGEWETFNYKDGDYQTVSSSENYRRLDAIKKQNYRESLNEALLGLTSSLNEFSAKMEQANGGNHANMNNSGIVSTGVYGGNDSHSQSGSASRSGAGSNGKCKRCQGSGRCSPISGGSRKNACHGSRLCGYCNGTGWIKAGASETKCNACNGNGKCKTCKGTGDCPVCHGTGSR